MATDASKVEVAATGAVYMSTVGATIPGNATTAWSTAWGELGFINEDGITETPLLDVEEIKAWQSGAIIRKVVTGSGLEFAFTAMETNLRTIDLFYPGSTISTVGSDSSLAIKLPVATKKAFGIDIIDGTVRTRIIIPVAQLSDRGEVPYKNGEAIAYPITISVEPDTSNVLCTKLFNPVLT